MDPSTTSHEITSYDNQVSESVNLDSQANEPLQSLTAIVLPPNYIPTKSQGKKSSAIQNQNTNVNTTYKPGGLLNHKYPLHVVPDDLKQTVYKHRLSYNTLFDAYYENGVTDNKYISTWHEGALRYDNIYYKIEHDWEKCYLSRNPNRELDPGEILWRFDYRPGKFTISTLFLKLQHDIFNDEAIVEWSISTLPTKSNVNPIYQTIEFGSNTVGNIIDNIVDVTSFVKGEYGFTLRAQLRGGKSSHISWQWTQLFRCNLKGTFDFFLEEDYGLDVKVELVSDIICDPLPERCEKALRDLLDNDNLEDTEGFAKECGANQLLRCCEMFEVENSELIL
ncbi:hypothetical protein C2G38_2146470 [Gigaspora rosea]|uniref:PAW domain-containing protein n=1 Tax=Gigaspora rosea TaxID=44941 RepID=A0A397UKG0_9GLOM|nr:hypothetical protein C2G38_2146470 [Gigaspora rosea]